MKTLKSTCLIFILIILSSCKFNPYGSGLHRNSSKQCAKISESTDRARCYDDVNESYSHIRERTDKAEIEEKKRIHVGRAKGTIEYL